MKFTEEEAAWLRAALDGKTVQWRNRVTGPNGNWVTAKNFREDVVILSQPGMYEVRIKPDVIVVNGIEVPAPEKGELPKGALYWIADAAEERGRSSDIYWHGGDTEKRWLQYQIIHRSPESAAAHGKAMRAHKRG